MIGALAQFAAACGVPLVGVDRPFKELVIDSRRLAAGDLFACRHCYGLGYASQQESPQSRFIRRSRKVRMRLGGSPDLLQPFRKRPRGMHQRTYMHLRARDLLLLKASVGALHKRLSR